MSDDEKCFLVGLKRPTRYGTTTKPITKAKLVRVIKHTVLPTDTLQGIALKYGTSMVEVKRMNKLWSGDSLHLHDTLDIPVFDFSEAISPDGTASCSFSTNNGFVPATGASENNCDTKNYSGANNAANINDVVLMDRSAKNWSLNKNNQDASDKSEMSLDDILSRIDSSIKQTAKNVKKLAKNSSIDLTNCYASSCSSRDGTSGNSTKQSQSFSKSTSRSSLDNVSLNRSPSPTEFSVSVARPNAMANGRRLGKHAEKRLQTLQDEFYQL